MAQNNLDKVDENTSSSPLRVSMDLERSRAWDHRNEGKTLSKPRQKPVDDVVYRDECAVLPENFLNGIDLDSMLPDDFKMLYPHGTTCCLAVLPFNDGCYGKNHLSAEKWDVFVKSSLPAFLRALMVQPNNVTHGFADIPARYYDFFPSILSKDVSDGGASFMIDYNRNDGKDDRVWFLEMCNRALNNLRKFFGQEIVPTGNKSHLKIVKQLPRNGRNFM